MRITTHDKRYLGAALGSKLLLRNTWMTRCRDAWTKDIIPTSCSICSICTWPIQPMVILAENNSRHWWPATTTRKCNTCTPTFYSHTNWTTTMLSIVRDLLALPVHLGGLGVCAPSATFSIVLEGDHDSWKTPKIWGNFTIFGKYKVIDKFEFILRFSFNHLSLHCSLVLPVLYMHS